MVELRRYIGDTLSMRIPDADREREIAVWERSAPARRLERGVGRPWS
jgi:hypothetical protein